MADIVVTGGGFLGMSAAMMLARDGHDVTVLERDPAPPPSPSEAWERWERRGVNQFRMLHFLQPRFRMEAGRELPELVDALVAAGALRLNVMREVPTEISGGVRPGDDDFELITGRRPVAEAVAAAVAEGFPGVTVRRGTAVAGLLAGATAATGVAHVTGVRTDDGEEIAADLVVDATGRRSPLPAWLEAIGAPKPVDEVEDSGFIYYGRHFRSADGVLPVMIGPGLQDYGTVSILTLPADNGTWGIGVIASAADKAVRAVRDPARWTEVVRAMPLAAHWVDGEPLDDDVAVMAKIEDRHRPFFADGRPLCTGLLPLADAWACTNPSLGRGISIGFVHAQALRDVVRKGLDDPAGLAEAWDEATRATVEPWYRATLEYDRHRLAEIDAGIAGRAYEPEGPTWDMTKALQFAAGQDPDCFRAALSVVGVLRLPTEALAPAGVFDKVVSIGANWRDAPPLGPTRSELLALLDR